MARIAKQIRLTPQQDHKLRQLAEELGVSQSEVVRRVIDRLDDPESTDSPELALVDRASTPC